MSTFSMPYVEIPRDDDDYDYTKSFSLDDLTNNKDECSEFLEEYGFIVVRDVLSANECKLTIDSIFDYIENCSTGFDRNNISTWDNWKARPFGMGGHDVIFSERLVSNRQKSSLFKAFAFAINSTDLLCNHDRWILYRPTLPPGNESWRTRTNIHLDINPWRFESDDIKMWEKTDKLGYNNAKDFIAENNQVTKSLRGRQYQGSINLADNKLLDGGFLLLPSFHSHFSRWLLSLGEMPKGKEGPRWSIDANDPLNKLAQRITMRAGSLVIWDQRCLHGSKGNQSDRIRCMQPVKLFKATDMPEKHLKNRSKAVMRYLTQANLVDKVDDTGKIVFGYRHADFK